MPSVFRLDSGIEQASTTTELDTSTNAPSILAINGFFCGFTVLVVLARIYVRVIMLKTMGMDDYLIAAATICGVGVLICFIGETSHGIGMHLASIKPAELVKMLHWQYFHSLIVTVGISLIKLSVATFLLRLVPGKGYKIFLYCMITFLVAFTCSSAGTLIWSCIPIRASWDAASEPNAKCFSNATFTAIGLFNSSVNIVTDVLFASLPIPMVWNLQVNIRTKISLIAILSLGYFACAASIVKTVIQSKVLSNPDSTRNDSYFIWNSIELYIGILAASLPSLRPLFRSILETTRSLRTRGITSSGQMGGTRHKYYIHEDGIGMNSLQSRGKVHDGEAGGEGGKYDVRVTTRGLGSRLESTSNKSDEEIVKADSESTEEVWPLQGIKKTVDVTVT